MRENTRSLWEQYDSEVEPWRRGRAVFFVIGWAYLALQILRRLTQTPLQR